MERIHIQSTLYPLSHRLNLSGRDYENSHCRPGIEHKIGKIANFTIFSSRGDFYINFLLSSRQIYKIVFFSVSSQIKVNYGQSHSIKVNYSQFIYVCPSIHGSICQHLWVFFSILDLLSFFQGRSRSD